MKIAIFLILSFVSLFAKSKYCNELSEKERTTYLYVDTTLEDKKRVTKELIKKLRSSLLPHERVTLLVFNPVTQQVEEKFNSCTPKLSLEEVSKLKSKNSWYLFSESPIDRAKEDFEFFISSLKSIILKNIKSDSKEDKKRVIEIFYNQSNRFEKPLNRIIILSDMIQNSKDFPLESVVSNDYTNIKEYKTDFKYSNVYVLMDKKKLKSTEFKNLKKFWDYYFEFNNAKLKNFDTNLKLSGCKWLKSAEYEGVMSFSNGKEYMVRLLFNYCKNRINNGWLIIEGVDAIPLSGKVKLRNKELISAKFNIDSDNSFHIFNKNEKITLSFMAKKAKGKIEPINSNYTIIFPDGKKLKNPKITLTLERSDEI